MTSGYRIRGNRSYVTSHYSSLNSGGHHSIDVGRGGARSQETSHSSYINSGTRVDFEGTGGYRSHTSHYSYHKPGDRGRLLTSSVSSCRVDENVHEKEKGDISFDDGDRRRNISRDDGDSRGDIRVDDGRIVSSTKDTIHFSYHNMGETVGGDGRGGYRSQTSHSSSHNPCDHFRLLCIPGSYIHVDDSIREYERGDSRGYGARRGSRYQYIIHSSFHNDG